MLIKKYNEVHCVINENEQPEFEAKLAFAFIEKWGMIAGEPDGEDSSGRSKVRMATPEEVVKRAFDIARVALKQAKESGLICQMPTFKEMGKIPLSEADIQKLLSDG